MRLSAGLEVPSNQSEEDEHEHNHYEGQGQGKPRIQPCVCSVGDHPDYKEVIQQMGVREELPALTANAGERERPEDQDYREKGEACDSRDGGEYHLGIA